MKTFKLNDFTEDGVLNEIETAEFLAKKFGTENRLDFSEIKSVSPAFIDALFDKQKIEDLDGRIIGLSDKISQALEGWVQRQKIPVPSTSKIDKKTSAIKVRKAPPLEYERAELDGERFTPTRLMTRLRRQLTGYIESAYPLSDPILVRARRKLLEEAKNGHLLAQEPYVESTPKYRGFSGGYGDLGIPQHIAAFFLCWPKHNSSMLNLRAHARFCIPVCTSIRQNRSAVLSGMVRMLSLLLVPVRARRSVSWYRCWDVYTMKHVKGQNLSPNQECASSFCIL